MSSSGKEAIFTSERDDTYGGDSNGDQYLTLPAPSDWYQLYYDSKATNPSPLHDVIFRYGGYGSGQRGMVWVMGSSPDITSCRFEKVSNNGLFYSADPLKASTISANLFDTYNSAMVFVNTNAATLVSGNTITGSTTYPIQLLDGAMPVFQNNTITSSVHKVIAVSGTVSGNVLWKPITFGSTAMPYLVNGLLNVQAGATLTIDANTVVKLLYHSGHMDVYGDLNLLSSPGKEVVFTSDRDDTYGGDSNGDWNLTRPASGDWYYIRINKDIPPLHDAIFRYGGYGSYPGMLWINACNSNIMSCLFEHPLTTGLYYHSDAKIAFVISGNTFNYCPTAITLENTNPASVVKGNIINGSTSYPILLQNGAMVLFQNNSLNNAVQKVIRIAGTITSDLTLPAIVLGTTQAPYLISGTLTVNPSVTLTIESRYRGQVRVLRKLPL